MPRPSGAGATRQPRSSRGIGSRPSALFSTAAPAARDRYPRLCAWMEMRAERGLFTLRLCVGVLLDWAGVAAPGRVLLHTIVAQLPLASSRLPHPPRHLAEL